MRIWSILSIESDLKWCMHLSRSIFLHFNNIYLVSLFWHFWNIDGVPEGTCSQVLRSTSKSGGGGAQMGLCSSVLISIFSHNLNLKMQNFLY